MLPLKPKSWLRQIQLIQQLMEQKNVFLFAVQANAQGGKTTFADVLMQELHSSIRCLHIDAQSFDYQTLLRKAQQAFSLVAITGFNNIIRQVNLKKLPSFIVIDNAHNLPSFFMEELQLMLQYPGSLWVCLLGDNRLVATLDSLPKERIYWMKLGGFLDNETKMFLIRHLTPTIANRVINIDRLDQFYHATEGDIAAINSQIPYFFTSKQFSKKKRSSKWILLGALFFGGTMLYKQQDKPIVSILEPIVFSEPFVLVESRPEPPVRKKSYIPHWTEAAISQLIMPPPTRVTFQFVDEEEEREAEFSNMAVIDRVLVIPRVKRNT